MHRHSNILHLTSCLQCRLCGHKLNLHRSSTLPSFAFQSLLSKYTKNARRMHTGAMQSQGFLFSFTFALSHNALSHSASVFAGHHPLCLPDQDSALTLVSLRSDAAVQMVNECLQSARRQVCQHVCQHELPAWGGWLFRSRTGVADTAEQ